jgi:hypothetical protein
LAGKQAAQIWRMLEDIPKCLLPKINNAGTIKPMIAPATYQVQGCLKNSIIKYFYSYKKGKLQDKKRLLENSRKIICSICDCNFRVRRFLLR